MSFLLIILITGLVWVYFYTKDRPILTLISYSIFWGSILFILFTAYAGKYKLIHVAVISALFLFGSIYLFYRTYNSSENRKRQRFSKLELISIFGILSIYVLLYSKNSIFDAINHYFFAEQLGKGIIPPTMHAFPTYSSKYHYGFDLILGLAKNHFNLSYSSLGSIISGLLVFSNIGIAADYLNRRKLQSIHSSITLILLFLGGGFFLIAQMLLFDNESNGLALTSMFRQTSWLFGVAILFILLNFFHDFKLRDKKHLLFYAVFLSPIFLSVGLLSASTYVLLLLAFTVLFLYIVIQYTIKESAITLFILVAYAVSFLIFSQKTGGMLIKGSYFDSPVFVIAPVQIDTNVYLLRIAAYVLTLAPIGTVAFLFLLSKYIKKPLRFFKNSPHDFFLFSVVLAMFCFPIVIWVENAAYWDNFCKFNYYGILASWIVISDNLLKKIVIKSTVKARILATVIILVVCNESLFEIYRFFGNTNLHKTYVQNVEKNTKLLQFIETNVPLNRNIYLLNSDLKSMYTINPHTNKSNVNLYGYIFKNFNQFTLISMETGRSIANFYDYNMFMNRELEQKLWTTINDLYTGNPNSLQSIEGDYILSNISKLPEFATEWQTQNKIRFIEKSDLEDWIIFQVN